MSKLETPASLVPHQGDYKANAWGDYTIAELGNWVHLFAKRASHRTDAAKAQKDITDAQNYLSMMQAQLDAIKSTLPTT